MQTQGASGAVAARARTLLDAGSVQQAIDLLASHVTQFPGDWRVTEMVVQVLVNTGRAAEAVMFAQATALAAPAEPGSWRALGWALKADSKFDDAIEAFVQLCRLEPDLHTFLHVLQMLRGRGRHDRSLEILNESLKHFPGQPSLIVALGSLLSDIGQSDESVPILREVTGASANDPILLQAIAMKLNYCSTESGDVFAAHRAFGRSLETRIDPADCAPLRTDSRDPNRRIRVGYMSPDFREHSVAYFIEPVLAFADRARFELICYSTSPGLDGHTRRFQDMNVAWRNVAAMSSAAIAEQIRADRVDILVDLAGLTSHGRLEVLAMRPAPIQVTYLGYPATPGMSCIDYRIVDAVTDLAGADQFSVERLWRLPRCFVAFAPPQAAPAAGRRGERLAFGSFNNIAKVSLATVQLWSRVLHAVPASMLVLKSKALGSHVCVESVVQRFERAGIHRSRLDLRPFAKERHDHLAAYGDIDIALDTAPYCGTATTCEALWMGVPVVTLMGSMHAGRVGASLLRAAGMSDRVAATHDQFVAIAAALADRELLGATTRSQRRESMSRSELCDGRGLSAAMDSALAGMWVRWCGATP